MSNQHGLKKPTRRDFLNLMGSTLAVPLMQSPVQVLIESIMLGASRTVWAAGSGITPRRYLHILMEGAPSRWVFDQFLTPYSSAGFIANKMVATRFTSNGGRYTDTEYSTINLKGINVPTMWQYSIPKAGGGLRPISELLDNLLALRGISVGNPDHGAAQELQYLPLGASQSTSAMSADIATNPIAAINASVSQYKYKTHNGKSAVTISRSGNMLETLLNPFNRKAAGFNLKNAEVGASLDASIDALNESASALHPGNDTVVEATKAAKDLLSTGFGNLAQNWNDLYSKYALLVSRSFDSAQIQMPGINDLPIGTTDNRDVKYAFNTASTIVDAGDLRDIIVPGSTTARMAELFAMAEYVLVNNLSSSISIAPSQMANILVNGVKTSFSFDEHTSGVIPTVLVNTYYNIAYSACLLELISQLKAKNIFSETVIVAGGEFARSARNDGSGSDHGYNAANSTIYSGAINGPMVLGNILNGPATGTYAGTWGDAAKIKELNKPLDLGHWASTLAFLLRVPTPITAGTSLLANGADGLIPTIELAKQV